MPSLRGASFPRTRSIRSSTARGKAPGAVRPFRGLREGRTAPFRGPARRWGYALAGIPGSDSQELLSVLAHSADHPGDGSLRVRGAVLLDPDVLTLDTGQGAGLHGLGLCRFHGVPDTGRALKCCCTRCTRFLRRHYPDRFNGLSLCRLDPASCNDPRVVENETFPRSGPVFFVTLGTDRWLGPLCPGSWLVRS